ncbi:MAG: hypothetical protein HY909_22335 [Deltaproteobacteria bacterium]|nr:hypothetical protein [Deltaproteobacteria bacterium]
MDEKAPDKARATDDRKDSVNRKREDLKRDRKESLSTHLSDEARAFFSDEAYEKAYKNEHDSFEDLHPTPEHPHEAAHSRRWMTLTGTLLFGIIAILAGGYIYTQTAVPETVVDTHRIHVSDNIPPPGEIVPPVVTSPGGSAANAGGSTPPAATPTATPEATPGAATAPAAPGTEPAATGPAPTPGTEPAATAPPVATAPATAPAPATTPEPTAPTGTAPAVAPPAPPAPAATTPAPAPSGQTPAQLLAAARAFRGPLAGRIAAYNTYFDAAPTDTRTMLALAMQMAEGSHFPEAEALATRATAAQPTSGQGWFILAFARKHQNNREGTAEARRRCTALGGQWANECRAL